MNIQLIAIDLDGTALIGNKDISPRLLCDLEEASARGIHVVPITGRQFKMLPPFLPTPWTKYVVLCNGAEVRALPGGELLYAHHLSPEILVEYIPAILALGLPVELSGGGYLHTTQAMLETILDAPINPFHRVVLDRHGVIVNDLLPFISAASFPFDKVNLPYVPPEKREDLLALLPTLPFSGAWSAPHSMEVTHKDATKGEGLLTICKHLGVDPACAMALGDSGNDVPMLRAAGFGVAMGNAPDDVKAAAKAVTRSNTEDGAAIAIEKYVLSA